jgi:hypothetical protein
LPYRRAFFADAASAVCILLIVDFNLSRGPRAMSDWLLAERPPGVERNEASVVLAMARDSGQVRWERIP